MSDYSWGPPAGPPVGPPGCYRHPERRASAVCRRCNRPICTDCMREAPVGWQCADCIHRESRQAPVTRWQPRRIGTLGTSRMTPVVLVLVALNVVVFLIEETDFDSVVDRFALIPFVTRHERYRLITAAFLHDGFFHIFLNMMVLVIVGPALETAVGRARFVGIYLLAAFGGEVCSYLIGPLFEVSLGASGAIFGVMGAYLVIARRRGWSVGIVLPLIVVNLLYSFVVPDIDWRAHLGGLFVGALAAWLFDVLAENPRLARRPGQAVWVASGAVFVGVAVALFLLSLLPPGRIGV